MENDLIEILKIIDKHKLYQLSDANAYALITEVINNDKNGIMKHKLIKVADIKEYLPLLTNEEVTMSKFAELLNEAANKALHKRLMKHNMKTHGEYGEEITVDELMAHYTKHYLTAEQFIDLVLSWHKTEVKKLHKPNVVRANTKIKPKF